MQDTQAWPSALLVVSEWESVRLSPAFSETNLSSLATGEMPTAQQTRSSKLERKKASVY